MITLSEHEPNSKIIESLYSFIEIIIVIRSNYYNCMKKKQNFVNKIEQVAEMRLMLTHSSRRLKKYNSMVD